MSRQYSPPVLISTVLHMLLVIILGLWTISNQVDRNLVSLTATVTTDDAGSAAQFDVALGVEESKFEQTSLASPALTAVANPFETPPRIDISQSGTVPLALPSPNLSTAGLVGTKSNVHLLGRGSMKGQLNSSGGGSQGSLDAVAAGLEWLVKQQTPKVGSWSLKGPYSGAATYENNEAATAMALLALQGDGNTHQAGKYAKQVAAGINYLLKMQDRRGNFFQGGQRDEALYTQAQCTIVVCELLALTQDSKLREPAQRAVTYCTDAQDPELGGWRYSPRRDSDTSVTGWMVMAMQSAKLAGLEVKPEVWKGIDGYLDRAAGDGGAVYSYLPGLSNPTRVMTAEGLLCRQYRGWKQDDPRLIRGVETLLDPDNNGLPNWKDRDHYYWYYATQVMHHMEGNYWKQWNSICRDMLVKHQTLKGSERGSWEPLGDDPDIWCNRGQGGRLYVTCLSLYMLEVYYRHLPIYSSLTKQLEAQAAGGGQP